MLLEFKNTPGATYESLSDDPTQDVYLKRDVRAKLCEEQGYLCAYCMRRIRVEGVHQHRPSASVGTIEHYIAQNPELGIKPCDPLDYGNMLAVCPGTIGKGSDPSKSTCDKKRGNTTLALDPREKSSMNQIYYSRDGSIKSKQQNAQRDIDEALNLNHELLKQNRYAAYVGVLEGMKREFGEVGQWKKAYLEKKCKDLRDKEEKLEFTGFILWSLEERLKRA